MRFFDRHKLINLRKAKGFSLGTMARIIRLRTGCQLSKAAVSQWEKGATKPSLDSLLALSETFDLPLDYFFEPKSNYLLELLAAMSVRRLPEQGCDSPDRDQIGREKEDTDRPAGEGAH